MDSVPGEPAEETEGEGADGTGPVAGPAGAGVGEFRGWGSGNGGLTGRDGAEGEGWVCGDDERREAKEEIVSSYSQKM